MKQCPFCAEEIQDAAVKCRYCGALLQGGGAVGSRPLSFSGAGSGPAPGPLSLDGSLDMELGPGFVLLSRYEVREFLGQGSMGVVYAAWDGKLQREVALKVLPRERTRDARWQELYVREARHALELSHPSVARVYDLQEDGGLKATFLVMERLKGFALDSVLKERGRLSVEEALWVTEQTSEGLLYVHQRGMLHGDLKPANLFLEGLAAPGERVVPGTVQVKIMDFGLSVDLQNSLSQRRASSPSGTLLYMAPERLTPGAEVTGKADIYALGVILYEMLSGTTPFQGPSELVVHHHGHTAPPRPDEKLCPPEAWELVQALLAKKPEERPESVKVFGEARGEEARGAKEEQERKARERAEAEAKAKTETEMKAREETKAQQRREQLARQAAALEASPLAPRPLTRAPMLAVAMSLAAVVILGTLYFILHPARPRATGPTNNREVHTVGPNQAAPTSSTQTGASAGRPPESPSQEPYPLRLSTVPAAADSGETSAALGLEPSGASLPQAHGSATTVHEATGLPSLLNRISVPRGGVATLALVIDFNSMGPDQSVDRETAGFMGGAKFRPILGLFNQAFYSRGYFQKAFGGDTALLTQSGALGEVNYVLLGSLKVSFSKNPSLDQDLTTCRAHLDYSLIDRKGVALANGSIAATGAGFSEEASRSSALKGLAEHASAEVGKWIP